MTVKKKQPAKNKAAPKKKVAKKKVIEIGEISTHTAKVAIAIDKAKSKAVKKKSPAKKKTVSKAKTQRKHAKHTNVSVDERYKMFALEYITCFNATKAAIAAGYSEKTANQQGSKLLANRKVQMYIAEAMAARTKRTEIDADFVLTELGNMAKADPLDIVNPETLGFKPITEWPLSWRRMLSALDVSEIMEYQDDTKVKVGDMVKMKFPDRLKILEVLGKHVDVQAFLNKVEVNDNTTLADRLRRSRERAQGNHGSS